MVQEGHGSGTSTGLPRDVSEQGAARRDSQMQRICQNHVARGLKTGQAVLLRGLGRRTGPRVNPAGVIFDGLCR